MLTRLHKKAGYDCNEWCYHRPSPIAHRLSVDDNGTTHDTVLPMVSRLRFSDCLAWFGRFWPHSRAEGGAVPHKTLVYLGLWVILLFLADCLLCSLLFALW